MIRYTTTNLNYTVDKILLNHTSNEKRGRGLDNNYLSKVIQNTTEEDINKIRYDSHAKKVLADKTILAWIMHYTVREFAKSSIEEIRACIEGEPEVQQVPVDSAQKDISPAIIGMSNEDSDPLEGKIYYDIRFFVVLPGENRVRMHINVEAQKDYDPGYTLLSRSVYYAARMISSQKGTEFVGSEYDDIKKVYSIWLCMNVPQKLQNGIMRYEMQQECLVGEKLTDQHFDLIGIVFIHLGEPETCEHPLLGMLNLLFSDRVDPSEKIKQLKSKYHIETTENLGKELNQMNNLGDWIYERMKIKAENDVARENEQKLQEAVKNAVQEAVKNAVQEIVQENAQDARKRAEKLFQKGISYEIVRECISEKVLSDEELHKIYDSVMCMV